ncbi:uncharacterized protein Z518_04679 [Rhinocladiella mackenziei CBS 650.93]|uniref:CoA-transferase family III n=1 Tax=Rhinocladiella mackenziei CBS 650.93 TaxID=1442369 RepID=A0A0D2H8C9_9EURO|nr:uncharacterized protein Z518_04679 [Rhinocladiella mackenziei CBS 650.93]KIX06703.1 hypothetical protein Z518_04679 [Rhinocladiella mackenziei CBS 650.93]
MNGLVDYSVPEEAEKVLTNGIFNNPLVQKFLPPETKECSNIAFEGSPDPSIPINWRFAESVSALKGYEAAVLSVLLRRKYGINPPQIRINTDHAQLFIMSSLLWTIDPEGDNLNAGSILHPESRKKLEAFFPDCDKHRSNSSLHRMAATNIYRCKDGRYFHLHGSMNPDPVLKSIGLPLDAPAKTHEEAISPFIDAISNTDSKDLQHLETDVYQQAGTICWSTDEYRKSEHGKANEHIGLFEIHSHPNDGQKPCWWADVPSTSASRPLAGLKVVDLTRIIAGPAVSRGLAELGSSVMRITAPHLPDLSALHVDLNFGKWNASLDLRQDDDRQKLRELILDADVFLQGYRPGVLDKYGFGEKDIIELCSSRERGIIYARENCYGWQGPWKDRSGWQQISDANCGVSLEFGRAMGLDEPVTPVFPNSDYCSGIAGAVGILTALLQRAERGGSYTVDIALNYYSRWLVDSVGTYPDSVWEAVWKRNGSQVFHHSDHMPRTLPAYLRMLMGNSGAKLFRPDFFHTHFVSTIEKPIKIVAPVLRFVDNVVKPGYDVSTRGNGVDQSRWPIDLSVDTVF